MVTYMPGTIFILAKPFSPLWKIKPIRLSRVTVLQRTYRKILKTPYAISAINDHSTAVDIFHIALKVHRNEIAFLNIDRRVHMIG